MRLKVTKVDVGLHPSQVSVTINAQDGQHYLVINHNSLDQASTIEVGQPVGRRGEYFLVELPEETDGGMWRVWVAKDELSNKDNLRAAE
jgi:hypothetical protein